MIIKTRTLNPAICIAVFLSFFFTSAVFAQEKKKDNNFEIAKSLDIYSALLKDLNTLYVDDIDQGELTKTGIDAMLKQLDPYTVYIPESEVEDYRFLTTGQYGGIGSIIQQRGDYIIIAEPYEGWPAQKAGLMAGDTILSINGTEVKGKRNDKVSMMLKGEAGTPLEVKVKRLGVEEPITANLTREKIQIDDVPYFGMIGDGIAYVKLTGFTQGVAAELKEQFNKLKEEHQIKGLILDLRGNGGGLLGEAVDIVNIFVPRGEEVVTTKGRAEKEHRFRTSVAPSDTEVPIIVMINKGSASASEIVSGAVQDLDRGVIMGQRSFGKGLVQNVIPLAYNSKMKITVAKYYIPSGRCIQAIDYSHKDDDGNFSHIPDSLIHEFKTKDGRPVYDGGGITPDITLDPVKFEEVTAYLYAKNYLFDYATAFRLKHKEIPAADKFIITDEQYDDFLKWLKEKDFDFIPSGVMVLKDFKRNAEAAGYFDLVEDQYKELKKAAEETKDNSLQKYKDQIKELLRNEIVSRYYYQKGRVVSSLIDDPEIKAAKDLFVDKQKYDDILSGKYVQPKKKEDTKKEEKEEVEI